MLDVKEPMERDSEDPAIFGAEGLEIRVAEEKFASVSTNVAYLISYDAAVPLFPSSPGEVHERVAEFEVTPEEDKLFTAEGAVVSGGVNVINVWSPETARFPAASFDLTR